MNKFFDARKAVYGFSLFSVFILLLLRCFIVFSYVPEITGVDNNFVHTVSRLLAGLSPYPNPEEFPYSGNIYTPLYFNVCYLFGKLAGVNPEHPIEVYRLCRVIALICDISSVLILHRILVKNKNIPKTVALLAITFFSSTLCYLAYTFSRVDCLFLSFYCLVFYYLTKEKPLTRSALFLILPALCVFCFFSKQNALILLLLIPLWLYYSDQRGKIIPFLVCYALFFTGIYLFYTKILGYASLPAFIFKGVNNRIDPEWFYVYIFKPLANSIFILPLCAGLVLSANIFLKAKRKDKELSIAFCVQLLFSTTVAFKWGSSLGYYYEPVFLSLILLSSNIKTQNIDNFSSKGFLYFPLIVLFIFFVHTALQDYLFFVNKQDLKKEAYTQEQTIKSYLQEKLDHRHVFDLSRPNRNFFKNFFYKEMAAPHFDAIDCCLLPDGNFDYSALRNELKTGEIKYVIFQRDQFKQSIWGISLTPYKKDTTLFDYDIYQYHGDAP